MCDLYMVHTLCTCCNLRVLVYDLQFVYLVFTAGAGAHWCWCTLMLALVRGLIWFILPVLVYNGAGALELMLITDLYLV